MVDEIKIYPNAWGPFKSGSCHLTTDGPVTELHAFATRLGLPSRWFQNGRTPHFDLAPAMRGRALELGAVFVSARAQAIARVAARQALAGQDGGQ
jgi:hypothetical protein